MHPPLGKQLIALGEKLMGYTPTGWRLASVVAGTIVIFMMVRVVRRMTRSTLMGAIAGVLIICDSVSYVQSRTALLDVFQEFFVLAAFCCLVADRDQVRARLNASSYAYDTFLPHPGPLRLRWWTGCGDRAGAALGARWWRFGCGIFMGLTLAVKYSGVYWIVAFGVLSVIWDITARREIGVRRPVRAVVRRDLVPSLWSLAVIPFATYIGSWWAWLFSEDAFPRHVLYATTTDWHPESPLWLKLAKLWNNSLWQWTWKMLDFHSTLLSPGSPGASDSNPANRHPWESKPWTWPIGTRPVLYYASPVPTTGCGASRTDCVQRIFLIGTPALWWISLFVCAWALWRAIARLDWRYAAVLVGYGAGYIPWFFNLNRQMYFFYVTPLAPFLVIGICLVLGDLMGSARMGVERRYLSIGIVALYVGLVVANFIWLLPMLNGTSMTPDQLQAETWLPSWGDRNGLVADRSMARGMTAPVLPSVIFRSSAGRATAECFGTSCPEVGLFTKLKRMGGGAALGGQLAERRRSLPAVRCCNAADRHAIAWHHHLLPARPQPGHKSGRPRLRYRFAHAILCWARAHGGRRRSECHHARFRSQPAWRR